MYKIKYLVIPHQCLVVSVGYDYLSSEDIVADSSKPNLTRSTSHKRRQLKMFPPFLWHKMLGHSVITHNLLKLNC